MPSVRIPTPLRRLTGEKDEVDINASNVADLIEELENQFPGIKERLVEDGAIRSNLAVAIDGEIARMGLLERVGENSEVHFVPAIGGGRL